MISIAPTPYQLLLQRLIAARATAGMSQIELANKLSRSQSYVTRVERNQRSLGLVALVEWALAVDADPTELFRGLVDEVTRPRPSVVPRRRAVLGS